jgi:polyribonucleotide nucleotidyltransferase
VVNPTYEERQRADLDIIMACSESAIVMVEGGAKEVDEETFMDALYFGQSSALELLRAQEELRQRVGVQRCSLRGLNFPQNGKSF